MGRQRNPVWIHPEAIHGGGGRPCCTISNGSLYEAAALGVAEFRRCRLMDTVPCPATRLTVTVEGPTTMHEVPIQKLTAWLASGGRTPNEQAVKVRLREILGV